jgi:hypothetical protein
LGIGAKEQFKAFASPLSLSVIMFALVYLLTKQLNPFEGVSGCIKLLSIVIVGAIVYLLLIWLVNRELCNRLFLSLRRMIS